MKPLERRAVVAHRLPYSAMALLLTAVGFNFCPAARADLVISSVYDSSITSDPNGAAIQGVINTAIAFYQSRFADPITVHIYFKEMSSGLGQTQFGLYQTSYSSFYTQLNSDKTTADDNTALAHLPAGPNNPVTNNANINGKPANLRALGYNAPPLTAFGGNNYDGVVSLNTHITNVGSPGSTLQFSLLAVVEHEIDEVLGLGSTLGLGLPTQFATAPSPEDLYRYDSTGVSHARSFTTIGDDAHFSINGTNNLVQFNQSSSGDYGDWWSSTPPSINRPARVQDAFAYSGSSPSLNDLSFEMVALDVIGYDRIAAVPEVPAAVGLFFIALGCVTFVGAKKWIKAGREVASR